MSCSRVKTLKAIASKVVPKVDQLLELGTQIAEPLDAAHASGIVQRDISPRIFLLPLGEMQNPRFGLLS